MAGEGHGERRDRVLETREAEPLTASTGEGQPRRWDPPPVSSKMERWRDIAPRLEELGYPAQVVRVAARLRHHFAQAELMEVVSEGIADVRSPAQAELGAFQGRVENALVEGRGNVERGLLLAWEQRTGRRIAFETRPPAMLEEAFAELTDERAQVRLAQKVERIVRDPWEPTERDLVELGRMLEGLRHRGHDLQAALIAEWERDHPEPRPRGQSVAELPGCRTEMLELMGVLQRGHPSVTGEERLLRRAQAQMRPLREMEVGSVEATAANVAGLRANADAIRAEWRSALERSADGPVEVGRMFRYFNPDRGEWSNVDVDVMDDGGRLWVEVKHRLPFTTDSSAWRDLRRQIRGLSLAAEQNPSTAGRGRWRSSSALTFIPRWSERWPRCASGQCAPRASARITSDHGSGEPPPRD